MSTENEILLKIITIGNTAVGKTSIIKRYVYSIFEKDKMSTIGINFAFKDIVLKNGKKVKLKLIDTAGQEKYRSLSKSYFKNTDGVLFVFSLDNLESFEKMSEWIDLYNEFNNDEKTPRYLIGNKCDLEPAVDDELIDKFLEKNANYIYKKTSAAENIGINELFEELAEKMFINYNKDGKQKVEAILLNEDNTKSNIKKHGGCGVCNLQENESN